MNVSRRDFLRTASTGVAAVPLFIPSAVLGNETQPAANSRVTLAHMGVGGQGSHLFRMFQGVKEAQSVAVCDCFKSRRTTMATLCGGRAYLDYREMLDKEDVDAVVIATPDHWHLVAGLDMARRKKHLYIEKPLGLTLEQNLLFQKTATENGIRFQYGTQQRAQPNCRHGCELVRRGVLGKIVKIEVDAPNGHGGGSTTEAPIPPDLGEDGYDFWLGPAPKTPFTVDRCRPDGTYMVYDQSIGYLGGWGAHPLDIMVWGSDADLSGPIRVEGTGKINAADLCNAVYDWDMTIKLGDVDLVFRPGGDRTRFIGEDGRWIEVRRNGNSASDPEILKTPYDAEDSRLGGFPGRNHYADFILGIREGYDPASTLKDAVRSDNLSHLCDIAVRTGARVTWDPQTQTFLDAPDEARAMFSRPIRPPWSLQ